MQPFLWPDGPAKQGGRVFGNRPFHHPDGRGRMVPVTRAVGQSTPNHRFGLNTGRVRDQWHTMTRTGLGNHNGERFLEIHLRLF